MEVAALMVEAEVVGNAEIASGLGVATGTPNQWARRRATTGYPVPDHPPVNGRSAWLRATVELWARRTGRLREGESWMF